ncbi:hypothetical protein LCGC14_1189360 [marine sediment metagenome]|uniref:Uncharacterized protein n=1 Tax=marine sediment metagenome TaxID=412755 RepID=A0A0F9LPS0_9ZZZZ
MNEFGVDISRYNGPMDFDILKANGVQWVASRHTIGTTYEDAWSDYNQREVRAAGLPWLAYHVLWPANRSPEAEAEWYLERLGGDLPDAIVLDNELGTANHSAGHHLVSGADIIGQAYRWMNRISILTGMTPIQYTGTWFLDNPKFNGVEPSGVAFPLWLAWYVTPPTLENALLKWDTPKLPRGYTSKEIWQFTSSGDNWNAGQSGFITRIDYNIARDLSSLLTVPSEPDPSPDPLGERVMRIEEWIQSYGTPS